RLRANTVLPAPTNVIRAMARRLRDGRRRRPAGTLRRVTARRLRRPMIAALSVALLTAACTSSSSRATSRTVARSPTTKRPAPSWAPRRPKAWGRPAQGFDFAGVARTYQLYAPRNYGGSTDVPLVLDFHGFGSNAKQQITYGNFEPIADRRGFIVVAP